MYNRTIRFIFIFSLMLGMVTPVRAQTSTPPAAARMLLDSMTPEERVGQMFIVNFNGTDVSQTSQIYNLVVKYHVGGVVFSGANGNFTAAPGTAAHTQEMINALQSMKWEYSTSQPRSDSGQVLRVTYIPLFIGIEQDGNGPPTDQIFNELTHLPSQMAIGATWKPELAARVGEVRGRELSALGFNLIFGPSLDVLEAPSAAGEDLGTRVFGGDPFWVGEMARAYIQGVHTGSKNKLFVAAKHFPGVGGADRLPEVEVSTVRKSLEQLKQIELAPFFAVTGSAPSTEATANGLIVSHIRYQGFQGNIRATTRPVSFDSQALSQILALPQFSAWRDAGGLLISDNLGTKSVRDFYIQTGDQFSTRNVARDAFLAGNDMLYMGDIRAIDNADTYTTVTRILDFFAQKYREDPAFAGRVDASVARILAAKMRIYPSFDISKIFTPPSALDVIGDTTGISFEVARNAATLISPDIQDIATVLPDPPQPNDQIVFLTDTSAVRQCSACPEQPTLAVDSFQQKVLQLYGPQSGDRVTNFRLASHSFQSLQSLLDGFEPPFVENDLFRADWIVISLTDTAQNQVSLLRRFQNERPDLLRRKHIILFSFDAPYYFTSTDISKFTAYYALYSKQPEFVDVAARLLFQELTPVGASSVSIPGVQYDLITAMSPDETQIIPLFLDIESGSSLNEGPGTAAPTAIPLFKIGDTIALRTGVILDNNHHPVPDGTVVRFSMTSTGDGGGILKQIDAVTTQGIARASFALERPGLLEIRAASEPAVISQVLQLDVSQSGPVAITVVVPELTQVEGVATPAFESDENVSAYISADGYPLFPAWLLSMLFTILYAWVGYNATARMYNRRSAVRILLGILAGGLVFYNYAAFGIAGIADWMLDHGLRGLFLFVFLGNCAGLAAGWIWARRWS